LHCDTTQQPNTTITPHSLLPYLFLRSGRRGGGPSTRLSQSAEPNSDKGIGIQERAWYHVLLEWWFD